MIYYSDDCKIGILKMLCIFTLGKFRIKYHGYEFQQCYIIKSCLM